MKGVVIGQNGKVEVKNFGEPLHETVGEAVGGYIETVHPRGLPEPYLLVCDENARFNPDRNTNWIASYWYGVSIHGINILGNVVVMKDGYINGEPDIVGLDDGDIKQIKGLIAHASRVLKLLRGKEVWQ